MVCQLSLGFISRTCTENRGEKKLITGTCDNTVVPRRSIHSFVRDAAKDGVAAMKPF
jgi:hypothetical protein